MPVEDEPLIRALRESLRAPSEFDFIGLVGMIMESLESPHPMFGRPPSLTEFVDSFIEVDIAETTAALHVLAQFTTDELVATRIRRELATRHQPMPALLTSLPQLRVGQAWVFSDVAGDADNLIVELRGLGEPTALAFLVQRHAAAVTDLSIVSSEIDRLHVDFAAHAADRAVQIELSPADTRARLESAMAQPPTTVRPCDCREPTDEWPAFRPFARMLCGTLPPGGTGYPRQPFTAEQAESLCAQIMWHPFYEEAGFVADSTRPVLERIVEFAATAGFNEPWRWSPARIEELFDDSLAWGLSDDEWDQLPRLLRVVVRVAAEHEGQPPDVRDETLDVVNELLEEVDLRHSSESRSAISALFAPPSGERAVSTLRQLRDSVGGAAALDALDTARITPLVDTPVDAATAGLSDSAAQRVREIDTLACDAIDHLVDSSVRAEVRAAFHTLLTRLAERDPATASRGKPAVTAAALVWAVTRANDLIGDTEEPSLMRHFRYGPDSPPEAVVPPGFLVKDLAAHLGVSPSVQPRARTLLAACGYAPGDAQDFFFIIGDPALLIANKRLRIALERDWVKRGLESAAPSPRDGEKRRASVSAPGTRP